MDKRPSPDEAAPYYFTYIDKVPEGDVLATLERQLGEASAFIAGISEERSPHRYAAGKWSIRQVLNHINDAERLFAFRALWFARGFQDALPSFEQDQAVAAAGADAVAWSLHIEEFHGVRLATLALFRNLPAEAWSRRGVASGNPFTVRALAFIAAGHLEHHLRVLRERYL
jgi:hypothetical protein